MMRNNTIFILIILILSGCIKPYEPKFKDGSVEKWVIEGSICNQEGWQEIRISKTSDYQTAAYLPINNCEVIIVDDLDQEFQLENSNDGIYKVWMSKENLVVGRSYALKVTTPDGDIFESDPDQMPYPTELSEANFVIEDRPTSDPEVFERGLQFYIDLNENNTNNHYFRWRITETWEIHSAYPKEFWYNGEIQQYIPPDSSTYFCWITREYPEIFTQSTNQLDQNIVNNIPLQFVSSETEKLAIMYSFLIEQIALSSEAFTFWKELMENVEVGEGLYASQPMAVQGNIRNIIDPNDNVLGFFSAVNISEERYFIEPIEGLELLYSDKCSPTHLRIGLREIFPRDYPAYLMSNAGQWSPYLLNYECVDCRLRGGLTEKPDFWP